MHCHSNWKRNQDAVYWVKLSRAQDQGLPSWQTKSHATIVHNPVLADCIFKVISQNGDRILFERLSTPRPAPKVTLKSNWHSQQQQPQQSLSDDASTSTRKLVAGQTGKRDVRRYTTDLQMTKKPQFEIYLRVEGVSQDAILQDEEKMKEINKQLEKVKNWIMHKIHS